MKIKRYFDVQDVAFLADVHENTVRSDIRHGKLKACRERPGRGVPWRITPEALSDYLVKITKNHDGE